MSIFYRVDGVLWCLAGFLCNRLNMLVASRTLWNTTDFCLTQAHKNLDRLRETA